MASPRGQKEAFAKFFEEPTRDKFRGILKDHSGETEFLDFKQEWPKHSALAKQILGFANTGNGCIIVGIQETPEGTLEPIGMASIIDKANIFDGIKGYLPAEMMGRIDVHDFHFEASEYPTLIGKKFQVMFVEFSSEHIPIVSLREGDGIKAPAVYVRRAGQTSEATHDELQKIINRRIDTRYSTSEEITLKQHMEQLKVLYSERASNSPLFSNLARLFAFSQFDDDGDGDNYNNFVKRAISIKKSIILKSIGSSPEVLQADALVAKLMKSPVAKPVK
ncbi:AlbA family DNA-binding domain-containing protein [Rhodopseudomonas sp. RCAM05734]|uniref:AlbA family DNA-binding domain-containing protein n=1 Tax=Rhodopseudomonas sp. RCAM05734 TaxID=3457549 RepID=UPI004043F1E9